MQTWTSRSAHLGRQPSPNVQTWTSRSAHLGRQPSPNVQTWTSRSTHPGGRPGPGAFCEVAFVGVKKLQFEPPPTPFIWGRNLPAQMCRPGRPGAHIWAGNLSERSAHLGAQFADPDVQTSRASCLPKCADLDVQVRLSGGAICRPRCAGLGPKKKLFFSLRYVQTWTSRSAHLGRQPSPNVQTWTSRSAHLGRQPSPNVQTWTSRSAHLGRQPAPNCRPGRPGPHVWIGNPPQMCRPGRPGPHIWVGNPPQMCRPGRPGPSTTSPNVRTWTGLHFGEARLPSRSALFYRVFWVRVFWAKLSKKGNFFGHPPKKGKF